MESFSVSACGAPRVEEKSGADRNQQHDHGRGNLPQRCRGDFCRSRGGTLRSPPTRMTTAAGADRAKMPTPVQAAAARLTTMPDSCATGNAPGTGRDCAPGIGVALQALQIGAHVGRVLVAQVAILLQRLVDDVFQLRTADRDSAGSAAWAPIQNRLEDQRRGVAAKGQRAVAISYSTAPNENRSVRASSSLPLACSGDM